DLSAGHAADRCGLRQLDRRGGHGAARGEDRGIVGRGRGFGSDPPSTGTNDLRWQPVPADQTTRSAGGFRMISVLILTLNEEENLPRCLESLSWSDDIHVLDSFSTDRTVQIARAAGARVEQRAFDNWAAHQNWALKNIPFKHPWVYYSDADERVTPE